MRLTRLTSSVAVMAMVAALGASRAQGQVQSQVAAPAAPSVVASSSAVSLPPFALWLKAGSTPNSAAKKQGTLKPRSHVSRGQSAALACQDFWIECNDGYTDSCCGSINSCGGYCAEVCGGPCDYAG
jgi:hypothetical protein